jgi:[NiFe] hydrogenase diaphorase moiety large subunit
VLHRIAQGVGLTPAIVEGVAGFYRFFHLQPVGRVHVLFSDNVTDRMQGSRELAAELWHGWASCPGRSAADGSVSASASPPAPGCATRARRCSSTSTRW